MTMPTTPPLTRRQIANRINRSKRKGLSENGRLRLREAALAQKPWLKSTGPRTPEGKRKVAANGKKRQVGPQSARDRQAELSSVTEKIQTMRDLRQALLAGNPIFTCPND